MMVRQANDNRNSQQPAGHAVTLVNIEHVITYYNGVDRTSVPGCSSCRQNRQTVAGEQVGEMFHVGVVPCQPDVEIADNVNRLLKRRSLQRQEHTTAGGRRNSGRTCQRGR